MTLTTEELQDLLKRVSPGEWRHDLWCKRAGIEVWDVKADSVDVAECHWAEGDPSDPATVRANAQLLAEAKRLAAEVIRLRSENESLRREIERLSEGANAARAALEMGVAAPSERAP